MFQSLIGRFVIVMVMVMGTVAEFQSLIGRFVIS